MSQRHKGKETRNKEEEREEYANNDHHYPVTLRPLGVVLLRTIS